MSGIGSPPLARRGRDRPAGAPTVTGSPPLARRGLEATFNQVYQLRLTSARAERTPTTAAGSSWRTAHLCSRGEDHGTGPADLDRAGSPPLARRGRRPPQASKNAGGSPPLARRGEPGHRQRPGRGRLTSARAERTTPSTTRARATSAHLRSRGEDLRAVALRAGLGGSPPLARRGRDQDGTHVVVGRLTSARAERTAGTPTWPQSKRSRR